MNIKQANAFYDAIESFSCSESFHFWSYTFHLDFFLSIQSEAKASLLESTSEFFIL